MSSLPPSLALGLTAVMVGTKLALLPLAITTPGELVRWLLRLAVVVSPDVGFVAALTVVCALTSLATRGRRGAACWRWSVLGVYGMAAVYAVASLLLFQVMRVPLSIRLLSFSGGPLLMASSIRPFLTLGAIASLIGAPLAVFVAPLLTRKLPWFRRGAPLRAVVAAAAMVAVYVGVCRAYMHSHWTDPNRWERRIAHSSHALLLASCLEEALKEQPFGNTFSLPNADTSDFTPRAGEAAGAAPSSNSRTGRPRKAVLRAGVRPKNVVLIVLESVGAEYFGVQSSKYPTTPRLDRLVAERGIVFENIYAQAACSCNGLVCLTASTLPRPDWFLIVRDNPGFDVPTVAQVLGSHGYRTCFAHSGHWSWKERDRFLKARGAERLIDAADHPEDKASSWGMHDRTMYRDVLDWIDAGRAAEPERPFFVFAYTLDTHHPYIESSEPRDFGVADPELARYLNAVRAADAEIGRFMDALARRGLADSTLVAITADHGESFGQHGQTLHSFSLYEQAVHVPLVLFYPGFREPGTRERVVGQHVDIAPTLLDLLGFAPPDEWQGRDLLAADRRPRAYFCSAGNEIVLGLRDGRYKYHFYVAGERDELFDLEADPGEERDLAAERPERCLAYRRRVAGFAQHQREFLARHGAR
ncbi:MAG TPA: sulfatase-like hydrolase/transferase [Pirellulales bacterium]|nr:sulfatase-like hydrolase/transferase [Pirellulales bacterium]